MIQRLFSASKQQTDQTPAQVVSCLPLRSLGSQSTSSPERYWTKAANPKACEHVEGLGKADTGVMYAPRALETARTIFVYFIVSLSKKIEVTSSLEPNRFQVHIVCSTLTQKPTLQRS